MIYKRVLKLLIHIFNNEDTSFDVLFALPMHSARGRKGTNKIKTLMYKEQSPISKQILF